MIEILRAALNFCNHRIITAPLKHPKLSNHSNFVIINCYCLIGFKFKGINDFGPPSNLNRSNIVDLDLAPYFFNL